MFIPHHCCAPYLEVILPTNKHTLPLTSHVKYFLPLTTVVVLAVLDDARRSRVVVAGNTTARDDAGAAGVLQNGAAGAGKVFLGVVRQTNVGD